MECPRDHHELELQDFWKHRRHHCPSCHGYLLLEKDVLEAIGHPGEKGLADAMGLKFASLPASGLTCPWEGDRMHILMHRGVELDVCPSCRSLWLDHGEYDKISVMKPVPASTKQGKAGAARQALDTGADVSTEVATDGVLDFVGEALGSVLEII